MWFSSGFRLSHSTTIEKSFKTIENIDNIIDNIISRILGLN